MSHVAENPGTLLPESPGSIEIEAADESTRFSAVYHHFYRTPRMGRSLSDGGGAFGFDITLALEVDWLIGAYGCDAIVETGCHAGDTTDYLSRRYSRLPVHTCDRAVRYCDFVRRRLSNRENVRICHEISPLLVARTAAQHRFPFYFLDAHGGDDWPLGGELSAIERGLICIHDFNIEHPRFGFDSYSGVACDAAFLKPLAPRLREYFTNDPRATYPFPCQQTDRRSGRAWLVLGASSESAGKCRWLRSCLNA